LTLLAPISIRISVSGGDRVKISGSFHKNGATLNIKPQRRKVEVWSGEKRVAGGWVEFPAKRQRCTLKDSPALGCY
jgi:hypothetical protein